MNPTLSKFITGSQFRILVNTYTTAAEGVVNKNLEHYRNLDAIDCNKVKPSDWDEAKPFEKIPGPEPMPIIGNTWRFVLPKFGTFFGMDFVDVHAHLHQKYGDISILKGLVGHKPMLILFNPRDIEKLHRHEGVWPIRRGLESFAHYRSLRKNLLPSGGLIALQGEEWFKFRSIVNQILMQPKNIVQYTDKMNVVADELVDNIKYFSEQNQEGQMPEDFQNELYKWSLESIGVVTMDTHLGCLKRDNINSEGQQLIQSILRMFQLMYKLDVLPSVWKYVSTPSWKEYVKILDFLIETNLKYINKYLTKIEKGELGEDETSALYQMIKIDRNVAVAMATDMMIAGVDTTGRILGAALYYLAKNPAQQQELRKEACSLLPNRDDPVTKETLSKAPYVRAVIKETTRMSPIAIGNVRTTKSDMVLAGYQIPRNSYVLTATLLLSRQEEHFPKAKEFLPERWLKAMDDELSYKQTNLFAYMPFGFGPRSCIGKRLATLELETALLKIVRNFELKWPHEDMVFSTTTLHGIARPLKIHVNRFDG